MPQNYRVRKCILAVFAHPDDETSASGGTLALYARKGVDVHVVTATRGELGTLGTGGMVIERHELGAVRERELRQVLDSFGVNPPVLFDYKDQELKDADFEEVAGKVLAEMRRVSPDVVITFGPTGISKHDDHIAIHQATVDAFDRFRQESGAEPKLMLVAIPKSLAEQFELDMDGVETQPTTVIDIAETIELKIKAWRTYASQEDAQEVADMFEKQEIATESFHQAYPPVVDGIVETGFWDDEG